MTSLGIGRRGEGSVPERAVPVAAARIGVLIAGVGRAVAIAIAVSGIGPIVAPPFAGRLVTRRARRGFLDLAVAAPRVRPRNHERGPAGALPPVIREQLGE